MTDEPLVKPLRSSQKPMWENCVNAPPVPEGFKQVMRLMGIEATGLVINGSMGFTVFDRHGSEYNFHINSVTIRE